MENNYELKLEGKMSEREIEILKKLEDSYPETVDAFKKLIFEEFVVFCKKQYDYGPGNIAVGTQLKTQKEIMVSLKGIWFRSNDKLQRLFNIILMKNSLEAVNESVEDAWKDLSVYSKIARIVMLGKWGL